MSASLFLDVILCKMVFTHLCRMLFCKSSELLQQFFVCHDRWWNLKILQIVVVWVVLNEGHHPIDQLSIPVPLALTWAQLGPSPSEPGVLQQSRVAGGRPHPPPVDARHHSVAGSPPLHFLG